MYWMENRKDYHFGISVFIKEEKMESELFCEDYYVPLDEKTKKLIEQLTIWKERHIMLYPTDILNMLIDYNFATKDDVEKILLEYGKNSLDITLPTCYIK